MLERVWVRIRQNGVLIPALSLTISVNLGELCNIIALIQSLEKSGEVDVTTLPVS